MFSTLKSFNNYPQIEKRLLQMCGGELLSTQIIEILTQFKLFSQLSRQQKSSKKQLTFRYIKKIYNNELPIIFQKVASFLLNNPPPQIPLIVQNKPKQYNLTKNQIFYIYCSMMLCLVPKQIYDQKDRNSYGNIQDFSHIFSESGYKTMTCIQYFKKQIQSETKGQMFGIRRSVQEMSLDEIVMSSKTQISKVFLESDKKSIEEFYGEWKVDFANRYIGGGALKNGCVQEEIMFANHPQLMAVIPICQMMNGHEALQFIGFKKHFKNKGYANSTQYAGQQKQKYECDQQKRAKEYIIAINALKFPKYSSYEQYSYQNIKREIYKAHCGFNIDGPETVISGNWGCGVYNGDVRVKFLIQWIAASLAGKVLVYCPFGKFNQIEDEEIISIVQKLEIKEFYKLLLKSGEKMYGLDKKSKETKVPKNKHRIEINFYEVFKSVL